MKGSKKRGMESMLWPLYGLLVIAVLGYAVYGSIIAGILAFVLIVVILVMEFRESVNKEGMKKSLFDILIALAAVVVLWVILIIALQTHSPVDVVSSCSMLPNLQRGEVVALHGIPNMTQFLASSKVPIVNVSNSSFASMEANMQSEFLSFYPYFDNNKEEVQTSGIIPNGAQYSIGLYNTGCIIQYSSEGEPNNYYRCYLSNSAQDNNLIKYNYSIGKVDVNNTMYDIVYTSSITIGNTTVVENYSNPVIVYQTEQKDYFYPEQIIHRIYAAIKVGGTYYILTKGDNNPGLDIEFANYPASANQIVGYDLGGIPILGYVKLILSGQLATPAGCNQTIQH